MSKNIIIIPARYASTRLPGKPLLNLGGKTMIQRVYEQCQQAKNIYEVIVATDDERIEQAVIAFGGKVMMTDHTHQSGTDRCAEVVKKLNYKPKVVINVQGDEPFISPVQIEHIQNCFTQQPETHIASLYKSIEKEQEAQNPNVVKVVLGANGKALYFSRYAIPYRRNHAAEINYYKHIGIYGYLSSVLLEITELPAGLLEQAESLEQLRWLENGYQITLGKTEIDTLSIDTPDDVKLVEKYL